MWKSNDESVLENLLVEFTKLEVKRENQLFPPPRSGLFSHPFPEAISWIPKEVGMCWNLSGMNMPHVGRGRWRWTKDWFHPRVRSHG